MEGEREPDFAAADAIATAYLVVGGLGDVLPDAREMARAYLALRAAPHREGGSGEVTPEMVRGALDAADLAYGLGESHMRSLPEQHAVIRRKQVRDAAQFLTAALSRGREG